MNTKAFLLFAIVLSALCTSSLSAAEKKKTRAKKMTHDRSKELPVRKEMNSISRHIRDLGIYIASEGEFVKEKNKAVIQKNLEELTSLFKNLKAHPLIETQGLSITQAVMTEQLESTTALFKNDKKPLARAKFNAALNLCVSCHTQSPGTQRQEFKLFADKDISKMKINDFERAELLYVTRDFEAAINLYDKFIKDSKKTDDDENILKALERQLIFFVKVKKSFPMAKERFESYLKQGNLNQTVTQEVSDWVKALSGKSLWENFDAQTVKEEDMEKFMKTFIADDEEGPIFSATNSSEVYDLNLSSILLDYYNAHPETKLGAKILYWLSALDKRLNDDLFFSLGDYYLLACMEKYPKDPVAKDCYEAYMDDLEINYLSKEKDFPPKIKEKIKYLQKLIDYKEDDGEP